MSSDMKDTELDSDIKAAIGWSNPQHRIIDVQALIKRETDKARIDGAIMGAKFGNAAFRQYNIADPSKPINLDTVLNMGIEQARDWAERHAN